MSTNEIQEAVESGKGEKIISEEEIRPVERDEADVTSQTSYVDQDGNFIELPPAQQRRLMWRIDLHLVPLVALLHWLSGLDSSGLSKGRLFGLEKDLHMAGIDFNIAVLMYSVTHILLELPSNLTLKRVRPSVWLPSLAVGWGIISIVTGFVRTFGGLIACRVVMGVFQAGLYPGGTYLVAMWYKRNEIQKRLTVFTAISALTTAFSGLLTYGINTLNGVHGYHTWRWLFIIEGSMTLACCPIIYYFLSDFPEHARFLSKEERRYVIARIYHDLGRIPSSKLTWRAFRRTITDWRVWCLGAMSFCHLVTGLGLGIFQPTILVTFGYTAINAVLFGIPIHLCGVVWAILNAILADRYQHRSTLLCISIIVAAVGFAMAGWDHSRHVRLGGLFIAHMASFSSYPLTIGWVATNTVGHVQRAVTLAVMGSIGGLGSVVASFTFISSEAPVYRRGYIICLSFQGAALLFTFIYTASLWLENRARNAGRYRVTVVEGEELGNRHVCPSSEIVADIRSLISGIPIKGSA